MRPRARRERVRNSLMSPEDGSRRIHSERMSFQINFLIILASFCHKGPEIDPKILYARFMRVSPPPQPLSADTRSVRCVFAFVT